MAYPMHDAGRAACRPARPSRARAAGCSTTGPPTRRSRPRVDQRDAGDDGANEFVFYDGPPFANGLPHYGHLLTGYVKDVVPRYQTMRGRRVERRFGWDCHGLPAEVEAEKQLGITDQGRDRGDGRRQVQRRLPRRRCCATPTSGSDYVTRQARWVDFDNDYKTLDLDYMESVMWAFKTLWDKGLVYEGFRVLAVLLALRDAAVQHRDRAWTTSTATARTRRSRWRFRLETGEKLLAWTTTPWTLPSQPRARRRPGHRLRRSWRTRRRSGTSCAEARLAAYERGARRAPSRSARSRAPSWSAGATRRCSTSSPTEPAATRSRCSAADFVTTEDGTGVVHMAPAFGEDDQNACDAAGIPTVRHRRRPRPVHVGGAAVRRAMQVFEANKPVIARPQGPRRACVRHDTYTHPYPHCWRCDNPLIYKAVSSWFVRGDDVPGPDGRAEPADHLGARRTSRTARSASGWPTPATGRSAATGSGARRSRSGSPTTRRTRASTSTARSTSSSATSACAADRPAPAGRSTS